MKSSRRIFIKQSALATIAAFGAGPLLWSNMDWAMAQDAAKVLPVSKEDPVNAINEVPYISTYYITPKANVAENVVINYYVTDYHQKGYRKDDVVETFTIDYWVNGKKQTINKVSAGNGSIDLGSVPKGKVLFALQATDKRGIKSHRLFQEFLVVDPADGNIPAGKILSPDLVKYNISSNDTNPVETTAGLSALLKWASSNGYRKVLLPKGIYRIDENTPVQMATKLTLDMNGATFKLNPNAKDKCLMLDFINCSDSHVMNGIFEGDLGQHDLAKAPNQSAWVDGISISQGSQYCFVEDIAVRNITGRGVTTNHGLSVNQPKKVTGFTPGDVDDHGQKMVSEARVTTDDFIDIADYMKADGFVQLGNSLKEQGNPIGNWVYRAHFYDASKKHIETIEGYLYRRLYPPANAAFAKFTVLSKTKPETLFVSNVKSPYNCAFIKINHQNIRSAGMALNGYENLLVESCSFTNCGQELEKSAFYAKDGLDLMQNLTFKDNKFPTNPHTEVTVNAGHNCVVEGDIGKIDISERAHSFVLRSDNKITSLRLSSGSKVKSGYCRVQNNRFRENFSISDATQGEGNWKVVVKECQIGGRGEGAGAILFNCRISHATLANCEISGGTLGTGEFTNCYIHDMHGNNPGGIYRTCKIEKISGHIVGNLDVDNCEITDWDCRVNGKGTTLIVKNSELNNFLHYLSFWCQGANTIIDGCKINNWDYLLRIPYYALKEPITLSNNTFTTRGNKGMVFFYHDVVGKSAGPAVEQEPLIIKNNTLNLGDSDYVVTGPSEGTSQIIKLVFENNKVNPKTVLLVDPEARKSKNVTIVER